MNFSDMYNDKLSNLVKYQSFLKNKILEKEISILKSEKFFPELVDFVYDNFLYMNKIIECNEAVVERETDTPVYVNGSIYTTFRLGDTEKVKVNELKMYLIKEG